MTEWWKSFPMVPHIVYFDILVTIQKQFINVQYRDTSTVENMVRMGVPIQISPKQLVHPYIFTATIQFRIQDILGVQKNIGWLRCGGCTRVISGPRPTVKYCFIQTGLVIQDFLFQKLNFSQMSYCHDQFHWNKKFHIINNRSRCYRLCIKHHMG